MIASPQWGLILFKLQKAKEKSDVIVEGLKETSLSSLATTIIKKATTLGIALSQKTSYNLSNFYIDDY